MPDLENLHFKIELAGTYWDKKPQYSILLNDRVIKTDAVTTESGDSFFIEFDTDIAEGLNALKIRLENKDWTDTIQNEDKTEILKDMVLHIRSIEVDEIFLGEVIWTKSLFTGDEADRPVLDNCVDLGWNGTWALEFNSPFYLWLLENL